MGIASAAWWQSRAEARMNHYLWRGNETLQLISKAHERAVLDLMEDMRRIRARMGLKYNLTEDEVTKLLAEPAGRDEYDPRPAAQPSPPVP